MGFTPIETGVGVVPEVGVTISQDPPLVVVGVTVYGSGVAGAPGRDGNGRRRRESI